MEEQRKNKVELKLPSNFMCELPETSYAIQVGSGDISGPSSSTPLCRVDFCIESFLTMSSAVASYIPGKFKKLLVKKASNIKNAELLMSPETQWGYW